MSSPPAGASPAGARTGTGGRLADCFAALASDGRAAFIPYLTQGYPSPPDTPRLLDRLAAAGADIIELGVPFSDPLADGPVIQRASWRALEQGAGIASSLRLARERAASLPPLVLFTYLNPILKLGVERFCDLAVEAGLAGVLVTDLPVGADPEIESRLAEAAPDLIRLVAPTTSAGRIASIAGVASGFLYYISRAGVTGARETLRGGLEGEVTRLRQRVGVPVAVGFGISRADQARAVAAVADGVVVGSALVRALEDGEEGFARLAAELTEAVHGVVKESGRPDPAATARRMSRLSGCGD